MTKAGVKMTDDEIKKVIRNISSDEQDDDLSIRYSDFIAATIDAS
jgi:calcium-dependent protein kinase